MKEGCTHRYRDLDLPRRGDAGGRVVRPAPMRAASCLVAAAFPDSPARAATSAEGQAVAGSHGCVGCHSPEKGPALSGNKVGAWLAPNITPDPVSGIGAWSRADVVEYLRNGAAPDRAQAAGPMAAAVEALQGTSDADIEALAAWLAGAAGPRPRRSDRHFGARQAAGAGTRAARDRARASQRRAGWRRILQYLLRELSRRRHRRGRRLFPLALSQHHGRPSRPVQPACRVAERRQRTSQAKGSVFMPGFDGSVGMPGGLNDAKLAAREFCPNPVR